MLLHLTPQIFAPFKNIAIIDLEIKEMGFRLSADELVARRPYPNKFYSVACRRQGQKAINGILIETKDFMEEFQMVARWAVEATTAATHVVNYKVLDREHDAASDSTLLWHEEYGGKWPDRWPVAWPKENMNKSVNIGARMQVIWNDEKVRPWIEDSVDKNLGLITHRTETFEMPTIERGRILSARLCDRMPDINAAFHV